MLPDCLPTDSGAAAAGMLGQALCAVEMLEFTPWFKQPSVWPRVRFACKAGLIKSYLATSHHNNRDIILTDKLAHIAPAEQRSLQCCGALSNSGSCILAI